MDDANHIKVRWIELWVSADCAGSDENQATMPRLGARRRLIWGPAAAQHITHPKGGGMLLMRICVAISDTHAAFQAFWSRAGWTLGEAACKGVFTGLLAH